MQGVSIITSPEGLPKILTIDVEHHDSQLNPLITGLLTLIRQQEEQSERADYHALSMHGLARAYGDDEPEYTDEDLIWKNPDFKPFGTPTV